MIEVSNLIKRFGPRVAVDDISFRVERGEVLGFLGPNGAGKTTTMRILTGVLPASSGKVRVAGFDVFEQPLEVKRRVGYLSEQPPLYAELSTHQHLSFVGRLKGLRGRTREIEIGRLEEICGLQSVRQRRIGNLSKGYRQRIGLAQALMADPEVLILDEPTIGLDPNQVAEFRGLIQRLAEKHTVVLSTHILSEVVQICRRVVIVHQGRIVANSPLEHLTAQGRSLERTFQDLTLVGGVV